MSPTPAEIEPQNFRRPITLLFEKIKGGKYDWLSNVLVNKNICGFLIDSKRNTCVHLIVSWTEEDNSHMAVLYGDDFGKMVELPKMCKEEGTEIRSFEVDWGGAVGKRYYDKVEKIDSFIVIGDCFDIRYLGAFSPTSHLPCLPFKSLENRFLKAAGRLFE